MREIIAVILVVCAFAIPSATGLNDFWSFLIMIFFCYLLYKLYEHEYDDDKPSTSTDVDLPKQTSKDFNRGYQYAENVYGEYSDKVEALTRLRKEYDNGVMFDFTDFDRGISQFMQDVVHDDYMRKKYDGDEK